MTVCIVVSKGGNWANETIDGDMQFSRITFQPTVDEYSSFSVRYCKFINYYYNKFLIFLI